MYTVICTNAICNYFLTCNSVGWLSKKDHRNGFMLAIVSCKLYHKYKENKKSEMLT
jgi:hypothetical protein